MNSRNEEVAKFLDIPIESIVLDLMKEAKPIEFVVENIALTGEGDEQKETITYETLAVSEKLQSAIFCELRISGTVFASDLASVTDAKTARIQAGRAFTYVNKARLQEAEIAEIQAKISPLEERMDDLCDVPRKKRDRKAIKALGVEIDSLEEEIEKIKVGKTTKARNGDGDRANPLPAFETAQAVIRGANGGRILAIRGDAVPNRELHGLPESWIAFKSGENGFWKYSQALGAHTSWSALNLSISTKVLGLEGKSIGTNGLSEVSGVNLETIRTTQLTGLPEPK